MNKNQKLAQQQQQQNRQVRPWNDRRDGGDHDMYEVAKDTSSVTGATWPPRSYSCSFCHREFQSAQALGGHMNIHRRERAMLSRVLGGPSKPRTGGPLHHSPMKFSGLISSEYGISNGGLCLVYHPMLAQYGSYDHHGQYGFITPLGIIKGGDQEGGDHNGFHKMEEELDLELRLGRS